MGLKLSYFCATGERIAQVSDSDSFTMPDGPSVLVRKSATETNVLEYRLAVGVVVMVGGSVGLPWTIFVDGIAGPGLVLQRRCGPPCKQVQNSVFCARLSAHPKNREQGDVHGA